MSTSVLAPQPLFEKRELHSPSLWLCRGHRMTPQMLILRSASPPAPSAPWPALPCTRCGHRADLDYFLAGGRAFSHSHVGPAHPVSSVPKDHAGSCWRNPGTHWALGPSNNTSLTRGELPRASTLASEFIHSLSSLFTLLSLKSQFRPSMRNGVSTIHPFEPQPPLLLLRTLL